MHGRISSGEGGGSGFCHRNRKRDSSVGCSGAERQHGERERGGCRQAAAPEGQRSPCEGDSPGHPERCRGCQHRTLGWGLLSGGHMSPRAAGLDTGHGGMLAELPPHRRSASVPPRCRRVGGSL